VQAYKESTSKLAPETSGKNPAATDFFLVADIRLPEFVSGRFSAAIIFSAAAAKIGG
jgi:hypothetical protein